MTTPENNGHALDATVALRKPDGGRFDAGDIEGLIPRTLLVIEIDARASGITDSADGSIPAVVTLGRVIGWVPPAQAPFGRTMLTGACAAVNTAAAELAAREIPQAGS